MIFGGEIKPTEDVIDKCVINDFRIFNTSKY